MDDLESRLGGLILGGFDGSAISSETAQFIAGTAGTVLFGRNLTTVEHTRELIAELQAARSPAGPPLLVATDQEGGPVARLAVLGFAAPSAMALGAAGDPSLTRSVYRRMGADLRSLGITVDLAPVADVNTSPTNPVIGLRSFGGDSAGVSAHVDAAIRGLHDAGVAATAKHFPGHGDTDADSHEELAVTEQSAAHVRDVELAPFRAAIAARVELIMTGHLAVPSLDPSGVPATLSRVLTTDLLRTELGYKGIIVTDDMEMKGVGDGTRGDDVAVRALAAGADLLLYANTEPARRALESIQRALSSGRLDRAQLTASLARVDALRAAMLAPDAQLPVSDRDALARETAQRSITLVRARSGVPPLELPVGARILIVNFIDGGPKHATGARVESALGKAIAAAGYRATEQLRDLDPAGQEYKQILMAAQTADALIAITRRADLHPLQAQAVADLALFGKPVVAVVAREPYDAAHLPDSMAVVATFGDGDAELEAAAAVLLGKSTATGRLPVSLARHAGAPTS